MLLRSTTGAADRRQGLRFRCARQADERVRRRDDLAQSRQPQAKDTGWPITAQIQTALENRTALRLDAELPQVADTMGSEDRKLPRLRTPRMPAHTPQTSMRWALEFLCAFIYSVRLMACASTTHLDENLTYKVTSDRSTCGGPYGQFIYVTGILPSIDYPLCKHFVVPLPK